MTNQIIQPEGWARPAGYANGVLTSDGLLFVAGQIGWTGECIFETDDFIGQAEQALINIRAIVEQAGGSASDIVRLTWFVTDKREYLARQREVGAAYRRVLGKHFPAMTLVVVADLLEDRALVEIEATANLRGGD